MTCQAHPVLVKKANQVRGSFTENTSVRLCSSLIKVVFFGLGGYPPVDGPKDPWPGVLSLSERFVGDPASLARDNINTHVSWAFAHATTMTRINWLRPCTLHCHIHEQAHPDKGQHQSITHTVYRVFFQRALLTISHHDKHKAKSV